MGSLPKVSSWNLHTWEEPPISGTRGSGTIFFSGCSGRCLFCQNYPISQLGYGDIVDEERLAGMMLQLQRRGAHNINLVTRHTIAEQMAKNISILLVEDYPTNQQIAMKHLSGAGYQATLAQNG